MSASRTSHILGGSSLVPGRLQHGIQGPMLAKPIRIPFRHLLLQPRKGYHCHTSLHFARWSMPKTAIRNWKRSRRLRAATLCGAAVSTIICDLCIQWVRSLNCENLVQKCPVPHSLLSLCSALFSQAHEGWRRQSSLQRQPMPASRTFVLYSVICWHYSTFRDRVICCGHCTMYVDLQQNYCCGCFWGETAESWSLGKQQSFCEISATKSTLWFTTWLCNPLGLLNVCVGPGKECGATDVYSQKQGAFELAWRGILEIPYFCLRIDEKQLKTDLAKETGFEERHGSPLRKSKSNPADIV